MAEDALGNRWKRFEVGDRSESTLLRLLERLLDAACYSSDGYVAYGCLPVNKHRVGKGGAVNGNEGLHSALRGRLNRLVRRTKGYSKADGMLTWASRCFSRRRGLIQVGWDADPVHLR